MGGGGIDAGGPDAGPPTLCDGRLQLSNVRFVVAGDFAQEGRAGLAFVSTNDAGMSSLQLATGVCTANERLVSVPLTASDVVDLVALYRPMGLRADVAVVYSNSMRPVELRRGANDSDGGLAGAVCGAPMAALPHQRFAATQTTVPTGGGDDLFVATSGGVVSWFEFNGELRESSAVGTTGTGAIGVASVPEPGNATVVSWSISPTELYRTFWPGAGSPGGGSSVPLTTGGWSIIRAYNSHLVGVGGAQPFLVAARIDAGLHLGNGRVVRDSDNAEIPVTSVRGLRIGPLRLSSTDSQPGVVLADDTGVRAFSTFLPADGGVMRVATTRQVVDAGDVTSVTLGDFNADNSNDIAVGSSGPPGIRIIWGVGP